MEVYMSLVQATGQVGVWPIEDEDDGIDKSKRGEFKAVHMKVESQFTVKRKGQQTRLFMQMISLARKDENKFA